MIEAIADIITLINSIPVNVGENVILPFGSVVLVGNSGPGANNFNLFDDHALDDDVLAGEDADGILLSLRQRKTASELRLRRGAGSSTQASYRAVKVATSVAHAEFLGLRRQFVQGLQAVGVHALLVGH